VPTRHRFSSDGGGSECFVACWMQSPTAAGTHFMAAAAARGGMLSLCPCGAARGEVPGGFSLCTVGRRFPCGLAMGSLACGSARARFCGGGAAAGPGAVRRAGQGGISSNPRLRPSNPRPRQTKNYPESWVVFESLSVNPTRTHES